VKIDSPALRAGAERPLARGECDTSAARGKVRPSDRPAGPAV